MLKHIFLILVLGLFLSSSALAIFQEGRNVRYGVIFGRDYVSDRKGYGVYGSESCTWDLRVQFKDGSLSTCQVTEDAARAMDDGSEVRVIIALDQNNKKVCYGMEAK